MSGADVADLYRDRTPDDVFADLVRARATPWIVADYDRLRAGFFLPGERDDVIVTPDDLSPTGSDLQNS